MQQNLEFYHAAIHNNLSYVRSIWTPNIRGAKNNVLFAQTKYGMRYTFKFNGHDSAIRNSNVSRALINAGIPAPEIHAVQYAGKWFEIYHTLPGYTLHEYVGRGATKTELKSIYHQLLNYFAKMSEIDYSNIDFGNLKYAHQTALSDTTKTNGTLIGHVASALVHLMNIDAPTDYGLYHHGLTPKNILVSSLCGNITGIIDIDEVGICNKNYAFAVMVTKAKLIGLDTDALFDEYEHMTGQKLNRTRVAAIVNIQNLGRNLLYRTKSK